MLFGTNGIVASYIALESYDIVMLRTMIGGVMLSALLFLTQKHRTFSLRRKDFLYIAASGAAMGVSWIFLFEAYRLIGVGMATLAYYCGPVIVMALSPVLFAEKLTRTKLAGFAAVLLGVFLVNGHQISSGSSAAGLFCGFMAAVLYAVMIVLNKKAKGVGGLENSALQLLSACLLSVVYAVTRHGVAIVIPGGSYLPILLLGLVNTGLGCYLYFSSIGYLPVQTVAVCGYLEPLSALVFAAVFLGESMSPLQIAGAVLVIGGAMTAEIRHRRIPSLGSSEYKRKPAAL